jgi:hypothetical protein
MCLNLIVASQPYHVGSKAIHPPIATIFARAYLNLPRITASSLLEGLLSIVYIYKKV